MGNGADIRRFVNTMRTRDGMKRMTKRLLLRITACLKDTGQMTGTVCCENRNTAAARIIR